MVQFLSIIFFLGFLQFLLVFSKVPVFLCHPVYERIQCLRSPPSACAAASFTKCVRTVRTINYLPRWLALLHHAYKHGKQFLNVVHALRPFRTSDTKLRRKFSLYKSQMLHFKSTSPPLFFTYSLYGAQKKKREMFHTTNNPHVSYHVPDCDEIWYECPY